MTLFLIGSLLIVGAIYFICLRKIVIPAILKKNTSIMSLSWGAAIFILLGIFAVNALFFAGNYFQLIEEGTLSPFIQGDLFLFLLLGGVGLAIMPLFKQNNILWHYGSLFLLCFGGMLLIPHNTSVYTTPLLIWSLKIIGAALWAYFIFINTTLDRAPFFTYITKSTLLLVLALCSSSIFPLLPQQLFYIYIAALSFNLITFAAFRRCNLFSYLFPIVFLFDWLSGFALMAFAGAGEAGFYMPIFIGYNLMEIICATAFTIYLFHRPLPVVAPFCIERAIQANTDMRRLVKSIFFMTLMLGLIGIAGVKSVLQGRESRLQLFYGMTIIVLIYIYSSLTGRGAKASLRSMVKDFKLGMKVFVNEVLINGTKSVITAPLQNFKNSDNEQKSPAENDYDVDKPITKKALKKEQSNQDKTKGFQKEEAAQANAKAKRKKSSKKAKKARS